MKTKFACTLLVQFKPPLSYPSPPSFSQVLLFTSYTILSCLLHSSPSLFFYTLLCCNMYFRFGNCGFCNNIATKSTCSKKRFTKRGWNHKNLGIFFEFLKNCRDFEVEALPMKSPSNGFHRKLIIFLFSLLFQQIMQEFSAFIQAKWSYFVNFVR